MMPCRGAFSFESLECGWSDGVDTLREVQPEIACSIEFAWLSWL